MKYDLNHTAHTQHHSPVHLRQIKAQKAIAYAAHMTGGDFSHLMKTAQRESSWNVKAKNPNSSAAGMFQFIEQTWLATVKKHGAKHGLGAYAEEIQRRRNGRFFVPDRAMRKEILDLRYDSHASSLMAAEHSNDNARYIESRIGRKPHSGDLYAAHFLGMGGAVKLIKAVENQPTQKASHLFPAAARANKSLFYAKGRPVSVSALYENLTRQHQTAPVKMPAVDYRAPQMLLAAQGGGGSRFGMDNPVDGPSPRVRLASEVAREHTARPTQLAEAANTAYSPTWVQILTAESTVLRGRKLFG